MDDLKEALAVHYNFSLLKFSLYIAFKSGIAATGEHNPWNRLGLVDYFHLYQGLSKHQEVSSTPVTKVPKLILV